MAGIDIGSNIDLYKTEVINNYICNYLKQGKKEMGEHIFFGILSSIKHKMSNTIEKDLLVRDHIAALPILHKAVLNVKPLIILVKVMKGGIAYEVALGIRYEKAYKRGLQTIIKEPKKYYQRSAIKFQKVLFDSIINSSKKVGVAVKKRNELYEKALQNRVYIKFL